MFGIDWQTIGRTPRTRTPERELGQERGGRSLDKFYKDYV
jgi:hypothetical protein